MGDTEALKIEIEQLKNAIKVRGSKFLTDSRKTKHYTALFRPISPH